MQNKNHLKEFETTVILKENKKFLNGNFKYGNNEWKQFDIHEASVNLSPENGLIIEGLPVEIHCHGAGPFDFSLYKLDKLIEINKFLETEGVNCILTGFLPYQDLTEFHEFMKGFHEMKTLGKLNHIIGIGLEGPLLKSIGGTPQMGNWTPTKKEWEDFAACGKYGLVYMVISPDSLIDGDFNGKPLSADYPSMDFIINTLIDGGVRPSLGHFKHDAPEDSAESILKVVEIVKSKGIELFSGMVITDHLFNDMPRNFTHTWRTKIEKEKRANEINILNTWNLDNLSEKLGVVPATLIKAAMEGYITLSLNFDGDHVDLEVCKYIVDLVGPKHIMAMTDRASDTKILCGRQLTTIEDNTLLYQEGRIVAAGTQSIDKQIKNMRKIGIEEDDIWEMVNFLPNRIFGNMQSSNSTLKKFSYVSPEKERLAL